MTVLEVHSEMFFFLFQKVQNNTRGRKVTSQQTHIILYL